MPIFLFLLLGIIVLALPVMSYAEQSSYSVTSVRNGQVLAPHPIPWEFHRGGKIEARGVWRGECEQSGPSELRCKTIDNQGNRGRFLIHFENHCEEFKAYTRDELIGIGTRISGDYCPVGRRRY